MLHCNDYILNFMKYYDYPEIAVKEFTRVEKRLDDEPEFGEKMDKLVEEYMYPEADEIGPVLDKVTVLAEEYGENEYTLHFVFIMNCTPILRERYKEINMPDEIFWDTMADMKCKLMECIKCKEVPGTFVGGWYNGFFRLGRFAFGRFQFEHGTYTSETPFTLSCGRVISQGTPLVGFHIPSSGVPLTDEVRLASYKKAYAYYSQFKDKFPDGIVYFCVGSWLLYPKHREFLPKHLNILRFMDDFELVSWAENEEGFNNDWRVFDKYADLEPEKWPRDTSLRKAYAEWICSGHKGGDGYGIFAFDGEKILR